MVQKKRELTGKTLNNLWNVGAKHALYREDGKWYHNLTEFPGALFDANGYIVFHTESEYLECPYLQIKQDVHVPQGISSIPGYVRVTERNEIQAFSQELRERAEIHYDVKSSDTPTLFVVATSSDLPDQQDAERILTQAYRIIRDTEIARRVKAIHSYHCQICGVAIDLGNGELYAESHHIKPLGSNHGGPDVIENILCVCPTCHVLLDYGAIPIVIESLRVAQGHLVSQEYIQYHNTQIYKHRAG
jgi:5-methylcytosine-specific restriction protein A